MGMTKTKSGTWGLKTKNRGTPKQGTSFLWRLPHRPSLCGAFRREQGGPAQNNEIEIAAAHLHGMLEGNKAACGLIV
jgi:hypothetical protein